MKIDELSDAEFRGEPHMDGGLSNFIPLAPATVGVRVCCFPARQLSPVYRIGIAPDAYEPWPYSLRQMVQWALEPADEDIVAYLIDKGAHGVRSVAISTSAPCVRRHKPTRVAAFLIGSCSSS